MSEKDKQFLEDCTELLGYILSVEDAYDHRWKLIKIISQAKEIHERLE